MTVNKPLSLSTNRLDSSYRDDFGGVYYLKPLSPGTPKLLGTSRPATDGLRTSTKNNPSLSAAPAQVKEPAAWVFVVLDLLSHEIFGRDCMPQSFEVPSTNFRLSPPGCRFDCRKRIKATSE
jgi:hypothetical protein